MSLMNSQSPAFDWRCYPQVLLLLQDFLEALETWPQPQRRYHHAAQHGLTWAGLARTGLKQAVPVPTHFKWPKEGHGAFHGSTHSHQQQLHTLKVGERLEALTAC